MKAVCYARYSSAFTLYAKRRLDGVEESELKLDELAKTKIQGLSNELCIVVNWYVSRVFFRHFGETLFLFSSPKKR